jgi:hypothetical protein
MGKRKKFEYSLWDNFKNKIKPYLFFIKSSKQELRKKELYERAL